MSAVFLRSHRLTFPHQAILGRPLPPEQPNILSESCYFKVCQIGHDLIQGPKTIQSENVKGIKASNLAKDLPMQLLSVQYQIIFDNILVPTMNTPINPTYPPCLIFPRFSFFLILLCQVVYCLVDVKHSKCIANFLHSKY